MAQRLINIGGQPNDNVGDSIRDAFDKINTNFAEIYSGGVSIDLTGDIGAISSRLNSLELHVSNSYTNLLSLLVGSTGLVNTVTSVVNQINTLSARFSTLSTGTGATISYVDTAVANSTASLASSLQTLTTNFNNKVVADSSTYTNLITLISNSTGSIATRVTTLESNYTTLSGTVSSKASISYVDTAVAASTASLASSLQTLTTNFNDKVVADSSTYTNLISLISSSTGSITSRVTTLESNYTNIATSVTSIATASSYIVTIANSVTSIISQFNTLNAKFDTLSTGTGATISYVDNAVAASTASLASSLQTLTTNFNNKVSADSATYTNLVSLISSSTGSVTSRVTSLESNYTSLSGTVSSKANSSDVTTAIANSTASITTRVGTLESNYTTLNGTVSSKANSSDVTTAIANSTASITTRVSTIESNYVTSSGLSSYATQSYVNTAVSNSTASIATRVSTLESNYTTLSGTVSSKANSSDVTTAIANSTASITTRVSTIESNYVTSSALSSYASQSYVNTAVANSTASLATSVQTLQTTVSGHSTSITNFSSSINGIQAKYGVTIDNNGAITGYELNSGGGSSNFIVKADNFKVYTGSGNVVPFSVSGSTVNMANAVVTGSLAIGSSPARSGTGMTGSGAVIANDGTFAFGNSSKNVVWDGSALTINGDVIASGNLQTSAVATEKIASNAVTGFGLYNNTTAQESAAAIGSGYNYFTIATLYFQSYGNPVIVDCQVVGKILYLQNTSGQQTFQVALFVDGSIVSCASEQKLLDNDSTVLPDGSNLSYYQNIPIPLYSFTPNSNLHTYELKMIFSRGGGIGDYKVAAKNVSIRAVELKR